MTTGTAIEKLNKQQLTVEQLSKICEGEGVTVQSVCKALAEGLQSNLPCKYDNSGKGYGEGVPDMPTRHKYMQSAMEVLRLVRKETEGQVVEVEHHMVKEDMDRIEGFINRLIKLEELAKSDTEQRGETIEADYRAIQQE